MMAFRRAALALAFGLLLAVTAAMPVSAALLWSLTASPLSVTTGVPTNFSLTATNLLIGGIECIVVNVPANFSVTGASVTGSTTGGSWVATRIGNEVRVRTTNSGDQLALEDNVRFRISASAISVGSLAWSSTAYSQMSCSGSPSLLGTPPVVVATGPAVTPSPAPTPPPTPAPTPRPPTPAPTTFPPLPSVPDPTSPVGPSMTPEPDGASSLPSASPGSAGSGSTPPSPAASASSRAVAQGPGGDGGTAGGDGRPAEAGLAFDPHELDLGFGTAGLIGGIEIWAVPAATIGVPGLLVLLWAVLQAVGALVWVPAVRRLRGEDRSAGLKPR